MTEELKQIKKIYGEQFSHLCRDNFAIILNEPGVLFQILDNNFAPTKSLYETIIKRNNLSDFKNYIFDEYDKIRNQKLEKVKEVTETPYEILDKVGYKLIECKTEEDIQSFRKYYKRNEVICTIYNGGRLKRCYVFFAVKKDVDEIKREDFNNPQREDLYSTSVLSIQFPKYGPCVPDIISRYNHTIIDPNATYGCNLDRIAVGLEESFKKMLKDRGLELNSSNKEELYLRGFVKASDGRYYKYNMEVNGIYYCENNIIIDHGEIKKFEPEKYLIIDYFIVDLVNKKIKLYDNEVHDSFALYSFNNINKIEIIKNNDYKNIIIKQDGLEDIIITIDKNNAIIGYQDSNIEEMGSQFLAYNEKLKVLDTKNVKFIGMRSLYFNKELEYLNLPEVREISDSFLVLNQKLKMFSARKLQKIGGGAFNNNIFLEEFNLPEVEEIGDSFCGTNYRLKIVNMPKVKKIGYGFMSFNCEMKVVNMPNVEIIEGKFLPMIKYLEYFNVPTTVNNGKGLSNPNLQQLLNNRQELTENEISRKK